MIPKINSKIWILALGRLLSQIGTGFTLFYAPIFFVNQVGLSALEVGIALGSASVSGIVGRFLGGAFSDSSFWGRRGTLLLSAAISAVADLILAFAYDFFTLLLGNLLLGLGVGLYWPATEAVVADLSTVEQRNESFAITRVADNVGLGIGVILGGVLISSSENYRALFIIDGISFIFFFILIYLTIPETYEDQEKQNPYQGWLIAFGDKYFLTFLIVNIIFTIYISQLQSTMPLYFKNFAAGGGFSATVISSIFSFHVVVTAITQLPVARFLNRYSSLNVLKFSLLLWALGFILTYISGIKENYAVIWAIMALGILGLAIVTYIPFATSSVVDLAPYNTRGVYLSLYSQCWAIGYLIGPPLGGMVLDLSPIIVHNFWLAAAASTIVGILILQQLEK